MSLTDEWTSISASARDACSLLNEQAKPDVELLLTAVQQVFFQPTTLDEVSRMNLKKQLGALVERIARRNARAMPFAALGRSALAKLSGADKDASALMREFEAKLALFGL